VARDFFSLPLREKMRSNHGPYGNDNGGYTPLGHETVSATLAEDGSTVDATADATVVKTGADRVENYVFRTFLSDDLDKSNHPTALYEAGKAYYEAMNVLLKKLNQLMARGLNITTDSTTTGLDATDYDYFNKHYYESSDSVYNLYRRSGNSLRIAFYPSTNTNTDTSTNTNTNTNNSIRYGAHTDYQTLTILLQDPHDNMNGYGGLQVLVNGTWIDVVQPKGMNPNTVSLVVNCGDLTKVWSNGVYLSNLHRVTNPTSKEGKEYSRISIPFFTGPFDDTFVEPVQSCVESVGEKRYNGVGAKEHLMRKLGLSNE
jgi:isopenicillin N synthase-like dioxygenase